MALKFEITGDNQNLLNALDGARNGVRLAAQDIERSGASIEDMFKRIGAAAGIAFSFEQAKSFVSKIVETRSFFQDIESSMRVFLGSQEKAAEFTEKLKDYAYYNMFEFKDLAAASQQMIAYGNDIDAIIPKIDQLSNIAVGTHSSLLDLVAAYNKAKSTGVVDSNALQSWAVKGIVVKDVLKEIGEEANGTTVTFEQLNKVLDHVTGEGGMFHDLQTEMMDNISAEIGQFEDNLASMLNEIGEKYQEEIVDVIKFGSEIVDNYETMAKYIQDAVVAFGLYKAALVAANIAEKAHVYWKGLSAEATMMNTLASSSETNAVNALTVAKLRLTAATKSLTTAMMANPYVLAAAAIATLTFSIYKFATYEKDAEAATKQLNEAFANTNAEIQSERANIDNLFDKLRNVKEGTAEYKKAKDSILNQYGKYLNGLSSEITTLKDVEGAYKAITKAARESALTRGKEAALKNVQDSYGNTYSRNIEKLQNALIGKDGSKNMLQNVQKELRELGTISEDTERKIKDVLRGTADYGNSSAWITSLRDNEKYLKDYSQQVEERFKIEEDVSKKEEAKAVRDKQAIENEKKTLQSQLESLSAIEATGKKGAEIKKQIAALDQELSAYSTSKKSGSISSTLKEQNKYLEMLEQQKTERERAARDMELQTRQAEIDMMKDGADKSLAQIGLDFKMQEETIKRGYEDLKKQKIEAARRLWEANPANNNKVFDPSSVNTSASEAEQRNYDVRIQSNIEEYKRQVEELSRQEMQYMYDFLSEYGTMEQKRYALIKEYEDRITKETSENKKKILQAERDSALAQINAQAIAQDIDWNQTFSGIGNVLEDIAKETLAKVKSYMKTDEYKGLAASDKKAYQDLVSHLVDAGGTGSSSPFKTSTWSDIARLTEEYKARVQDFLKAQETHKDAVDKLIEAEKELKNAATPAAKAIAQLKVEAAQNFVDETGQQVNSSQREKDDANQRLHNATEAASAGLQNFNTILSQLTSGTLSGFAVGVANLVNQISGSSGKAAASLGELGGKAGGLIGAILQIIDALGDEPTEFISGLLDKIASVVEAVLSELPQIIVKVIEGVGNIISGVVKGVANLFTLGSAFGSNEDEMEAEIERLAQANDALSKSIDTLADKISASDSTNKESLDAYKQAYEAEKEWQKNQQNAINARASEYTNSGYGFLGLGGKHSFNANMAGNDWAGWADFTRALQEHGINKNVNRDNIWSLSPEEMEILREFSPTRWAELFTTDGHKNPQDLVNEYINHSGRLDELTDVLNEKLTGYSWDGFLDSYKSLLKNLDSTTEDFADHIQELITNALIESFVNETLKGDIRELYDFIAKAAMDGIDASEQEKINAMNEAIAKKSMEWRDAMQEAGLIGASSSSGAYEQSASKGGWESMGEDTGQELNGRFTALQMSNERISEGVLSMIATMASLYANSETGNLTLLEIRNLLITNNAFLEDILEATKGIYKDFGKKLDKIGTNTK